MFGCRLNSEGATSLFQKGPFAFVGKGPAPTPFRRGLVPAGAQREHNAGVLLAEHPHSRAQRRPEQAARASRAVAGIIPVIPAPNSRTHQRAFLESRRGYFAKPDNQEWARGLGPVSPRLSWP